MSTINVNLMADNQGGVLAPISSVMRNRIINGAMTIDQRNVGASVTPTDNAYTLDRWQYSVSQSSKLTAQQNTTAPAGFVNSLKTTSSSAYSIVSTDYFMINQRIEGFNIADLGWGTANAKTVTVSFQVYSSLTGTFGGCINNANNDRSYPFTYSIPTANTWTSISVTIAGDTTGTWATNNGVGLTVRFGLGVGSTYSGTAGSWSGSTYFGATGATSVVGTSGATFYITGVQLEKGTQATGFEYRQFTNELQLCQRYFQKSYNLETKPATSLSGGDLSLIDAAWSYATTNSIGNWTGNLPVSMRANPTLTTYDHLGNSGKIGTQDNNGTITNNIAPNYVRASQTQAMVQKYTQSCSGIVFAYTLSSEL